MQSTLLWVRRYIAGLSPPNPGFPLGPVRVKFVMDEVAILPPLPRVTRLSPFHNIPPRLHFNFHLNAAVIGRRGWILRTLKGRIALSDTGGALDRNVLSFFFF